MKLKMLIASLILAIIGYLNSPSYAANDSKWICFKSNNELKVTGKDSKEKKAACEKKSGMWIEMVINPLQKEPVAVPETPKQSSGGGGGW